MLFGDARPPEQAGASAASCAASSPTLPDARPGQTRSLYRKYRPATFAADELVGQEPIVRTLRNAIARDRVAHAYLFCGPRGTGKTSTARLLAKAVNCLAPDPDDRPCGICTSCQAIASGAATDVVEIDAASNRGIDDIRELRERIKYAPTQLRTKFYIIDEAHQITGAAANAFLKTLEEPPPHTKFVLATTDPEELLPTIVSRCQRFDFRRIALEPMVARLKTIAGAEGLVVSDEALQAIARAGTGSLRDAEGLLDQLAVYQHDAPDDEVTDDRGIGVAQVRALLGISRNDRIETLVTALAERDPKQALTVVNEAVEAGEDPRQLNHQLVAYLRVLLHERAGGAADADETARELAQRFELRELAAHARRFSEIDYRMRHSPFPQLPLEVALVDAVLVENAVPALPAVQHQPSLERAAGDGSAPVAEPPAPPRPSLRSRVRGQGPTAQRKPATPPVAPPEPAAPSDATTAMPPTPSPAAVAGDGGVTVESLVELWPRIRMEVKAVNRRIEALLTSVDPVAVEGDRIILTAAYEFHRNRMNADEVRNVVEDVISRLVNRPVHITCVMPGDVTRPASAPTSSPSTATTLPPATVNAPDEALPAPNPASATNISTNRETGDETASGAPSPEEEARRIRAVKNIFDAVEVKG